MKPWIQLFIQLEWIMFLLLTDKPIGNKLPREPRRKLQDNIGMDLKELVVLMLNWTGLTQKIDG